jgi:choline dehydrogenase
MSTPSDKGADCEYVVVGSGAGGATVAARLAEQGRTVVLLEAGSDSKLVGDDKRGGQGENRLPADYDVPAFHAYASENAAMKWDFFVRHYGDNMLQQRDPKYRYEWDGRRVDGVLYPRAGTLGGCTAHNAMIFVYPHNADWDHIAELTGDRSWNAQNMRHYFERLENCNYRPAYRWFAKAGIDPTRHGWNGWLQTEKLNPLFALNEREFVKVMLLSAQQAFAETGERIENLIKGQFDPNDWRLVNQNAVGLMYTPLTTRKHARSAARERLLEIAKQYPDRLRIELNALATRVVLDRENRATAVEYLHGERLYRAHSQPSGEHGERREIRASREVIICGGAFNTPQLLMLSGIGSREVLGRNGIDLRVDLPGVGKNLQDRYEVGIVNRMDETWEMLKGARFAKGDPLYERWAKERSGVYSSNGVAMAVTKRSSPERALPDLCFLGLLGPFKGYFPNYSALFAEHLNYLTWTILKAHTNNRAGEVTLRSADPRDTPLINFHYFEEGDNDHGEDLDATVDGIKFVRSMTAKLKKAGLIAEEELPGEQVQSDEDLREFVRANAWGHHASCTCPIGPRNAGGVLGSDFRVHGTKGLRVVDASVFPRIPGFFIASAIYMVGEKAVDVILADVSGGGDAG